MKLRFLALSLASVVAVSATAQEVTSSDYAQTEPAKNVSFKKNKASDNWFIQLQGGVNVVQGFTSAPLVGNPAFADRLGYSAGLGIGKWHNPYFGTRLMVDWNWITNNYMEKAQNKKYPMAHNLNPHFDFIFDMMNYFGVYSADRVFSIKPYIGVGYAGTQMLFSEKKNTDAYLKNANFVNTVTGNLGASFDFRLGKRVSLNIAPSVVFGKFLNNVEAAYHKPLELMGQLKAGLTFDAGRTDFEVIEPMDYALLNDLNSQINALRAENAELSKRPVSCPDCPEVSQTVVNSILDNVVYFRLNSTVVDKNQLINVFNTAEFVKSNKTAIKVIGYADEKTGSSAYNMSLSEKRAKEVARLLVDKYGVPSELITIDWKGSDEQPYAENAWNRVVIMKANN